MEEHAKGTAIVLPALALCASLIQVALAAAVVGATGWNQHGLFLGTGGDCHRGTGVHRRASH